MPEVMAVDLFTELLVEEISVIVTFPFVAAVI
jgi:hypothetical protein